MNYLKNIIYLLGIIAIFCMSACSDDTLFLSNENGSTLREDGDYRISSFTLDKTMWELKDDKVNDFTIRLRSGSDDTEYTFDSRIEPEGESLRIIVKIPKNVRIEDGDYEMTAISNDGTHLGNKLSVTFRDEMFYALLGSTVDYGLRGDGTEKSPYLIESQDDFAQFEYGLSRDNTAHGAGLYFRQTGDFTAPPRSDAYQGRYYAGYRFAGSYDGAGHSISVQYIGSHSESDDSVGLFKALCNGAEIKNLTLQPRMQGIRRCGGALAGVVEGNVSLKNVTVDGSLSDCGDNIGAFVGLVTGTLSAEKCRLFASVSGKINAGGLAGSVEKGEIHVKDFSNLDDNYSPRLFSVTAEKCAGGIAGSISESKSEFSTIELRHLVSEQDKEIKVIYSSTEYAGGIAARIVKSKGGAFNNIKSFAPVRSAGSYVGGLAGEVTDANGFSASVCSVCAPVCGRENVGGFFGWIKTDGKLTFSGRDRSSRVAQVDNGYLVVEGRQYVGGLFGYLENGVNLETEILVNTSVKASEHFGGGIAGELNSVKLDAVRFFIDTDLVVEGPDAVGGLAGYALNSTITGRNYENGKDIDMSSLPTAEHFITDFTGTVRGGQSTGGAVGFSDNSILQGICVTGTIIGSLHVGGIVGHFKSGNSGAIKNCVNKVVAIKNHDGSCTGGIAGRIQYQSGTLHHLVNFSDIESGDLTGGIFGLVEFYGTDEFTVEYVLNFGDITGGENVGGCIGRIDYHTPAGSKIRNILRSANYGDVTGASGNIGGIIGHGDTAAIRVMHCANHGDVMATGNAKVGGIAGRLGRDADAAGFLDNMEMAYCCNRGEISSKGSDSHVGGLLGYQEEGHFSDDTHWETHDCYNAGNVTSDQHHDNGGIVGCVDHFAEVVRCLNIGKVSYGNGVVGTHKSGCVWYHHDLYYLKGTGKGWCADSFSEDKKKDKGAFHGFDFDREKTWVIDESETMNNGFPYLSDCPFQSMYR